MMGHVRAMTKGEMSDENAHPFDVGNYVGAHNGTLKDRRYEHKTKTDSELFFQDIEERGLRTVLEDLDKDSAYAISMFDKANRQLVFATNGKRPLHYCYHNKRHVLYWASEKEMLKFCIARRDLDVSEIYPFAPGMIYRIDVRDNITTKHPKWSLTSLKKEEPKVTYVTDSFGETGTFGGFSNLPLLPAPNSASNVLPFVPDDKRPLNLNLMRQQILENNKKRKQEKQNKKVQNLISKCVYCSRDMDLWDKYKGIEIDTDTYTCRECEDINAQIANDVRRTVH